MIINWGAQHIRCFLGDEKPSSLGYNSETFQQHGVNHGEMTQGPHAKVLLLSFFSCSGHVGTVEKMDVPDLGKPHMAIQGEFAHIRWLAYVFQTDRFGQAKARLRG